MSARPLILTAALVMLASCGDGASDGAPDQAGGPPPLPPYQMRAAMPDGDRLAGAGGDGEALYSNRCGSCHLPGGMGTNLLSVQQMRAGNPPEMGLLANRNDLTSDYIKSVVRNGKVAMPPISRVEVTDAELDAIATYLAGGD